MTRFPYAEAYARPLALETVRVSVRECQRWRRLLKEAKVNRKATREEVARRGYTQEFNAEERGEYRVWIDFIKERLHTAKLRIAATVVIMDGQASTWDEFLELGPKLRSCALDLNPGLVVVTRGGPGMGPDDDYLEPKLVMVHYSRNDCADFGNGPGKWRNQDGLPGWFEQQARYEAEQKAKEEAKTAEKEKALIDIFRESGLSLRKAAEVLTRESVAEAGDQTPKL